MFVGHFPNLRSLAILDTSLQPDGLPIPKDIHTWRGSLCVNLTTGNVDALCDRLAELEPEYNELRFFGEYKHGLVVAVERSLEPFTLTLLLLTSS